MHEFFANWRPLAFIYDTFIQKYIKYTRISLAKTIYFSLVKLNFKTNHAMILLVSNVSLLSARWARLFVKIQAVHYLSFLV